MDSDNKIGVLFICMGNICRSPTAEGVLRHVIAEAGIAEFVEVESAGTHAYHLGEPPDRRAQEAARRRGFELGRIRARRIDASDFDRFDYILAMDQDNHRMLIEMADSRHHEKIRLFMEFGSGTATEVPDPYYGGATGFERVLDLVEEAARGLVDVLKERIATAAPGRGAGIP